MDNFQGLPASQRKFVFPGNSVTAGTAWEALRIPPWAKRMAILAIGGGGNGGTGVVGANSTAAGGGGGGSGGQTFALIETEFLPDQIFVSAGGQGIASRVSIVPDATANHCIAIANGGGNGGNASGATGGAAGAAGAVATLAAMPLAGAGITTLLAGQAGIIGGAAVAGAALTLPVTGLFVTGGTGGGGLPAAAATGTNGGSFTVPAGGFFPANAGGVGSATATNPAASGTHGIFGFNGLDYYYGGTGGASTHGTATGGGLVQSSGGNGAYGCGGGGMGGALTGSTVGVIGRGGPGLVTVIFI